MRLLTGFSYSILTSMDLDPLENAARFFSRFKLLHYKKGELLLRPDDIPSGVFYLKKGYVRQYVISKEGQELTTIIYKPGDLFPLMWGLNEMVSNRYFEAMVPLELYRIPKETLLDFIKKEPEVLLKLTGRILNRLHAVSERLEYLAFGSAYAKVASIILICAKRLGEKKDHEVVIPLPLTHRDIASLVGVTRETTSIELKKLEKKNIIGYQGRLLVVKSMDRLQKESLLDSSSE